MNKRDLTIQISMIVIALILLVAMGYYLKELVHQNDLLEEKDYLSFCKETIGGVYLQVGNERIELPQINFSDLELVD